MNDRGKSDSRVVPMKRANKTGRPVAEPVEERRLAKGNTDQQNASRTLSRDVGASSALERVRQVARKDKEARFTALLHHVDVDRLRGAYSAINPKAASGVDRVTWAGYGQDLRANLEDLLRRVHSGAYRASPSRRVYIPKPDGRQRPLGIATLEDKIVQRAVVEVLNAIYEEDFLGFSYGFRPGRKPARRARCAGGRDREEEGELGTRRGHPWVLRRHRPRVAPQVRRASDRGQAGPAAHPEMAERGSDRGRVMVGKRGGSPARGQCIALARERLPALRLRSVGPAMAEAAGSR